MSHEAAYPETSRTPEVRLFNVDAMSDAQIVALHRGFVSAFDYEDVANGHNEQNIAGEMRSQLIACISDLTSREPERIRGLIEWCMDSNNGYDHELAVQIVPSLASYDYPFTRETMMSLVFEDSDFAGEEAFLAIPRLMRDHLTSDQIADLNSHLQARGHEPMNPASPES